MIPFFPRCRKSPRVPTGIVMSERLLGYDAARPEPHETGVLATHETEMACSPKMSNSVSLKLWLVLTGTPRGDRKIQKDLGAIEREAARQLGLSNEQLQDFRKWKGGGGLDEFKKGTT